MKTSALIPQLLIGLCIVAGIQTSVRAGSATSTFAVTATLDPTCTIQTTPVSFGQYNPVTVHAAKALDVTGSVTITCSKGMTTTIALDPGQYAAHAVGTTRAMKHASEDEYLNYELYQDVTRVILWGSAGENLFVPPVAPDTTPRTFFIFGRIPPAQNVSTGKYFDTVVAIVNF